MTASAKTLLMQDITAMQTMSSRIAAAACRLPEADRDDVLVELLTEMIASAGCVIAVSCSGDEAEVAKVLDITTLRLAESTTNAVKMLRDFPIDLGAAG